MELNLLSSFLGGVLTLLSPCSAMLLPAFFSYAFSGPAQLVTRTGLFYLGLITTLVPIGVLAGSLGALVSEHRDAFVSVAALIVIVLGALMILNVNLPLPGSARTAFGTTPVAVYLLGTVYGLAGVCAGPLLGAVLAYASLSGDAFTGGSMLLSFAAGMAMPLLVLALIWRKLPFIQRLVRPKQISWGRWHSTWTTLASGVVILLLGLLLLLSRGTAELSGVLGASEQIALEGAARQAAAHVPDLAVIAVAALATLSIWLVVRRRSQPIAKDKSHD